MRPLHLFGIALLMCLILGIIVGGAVLIWQSYAQSMCSDWAYESPYYPFWQCSYSAASPYGASCNTECYCISPTFNVDCLPMHDGPSKTMLIWGSHHGCRRNYYGYLLHYICNSNMLAIVISSR